MYHKEEKIGTFCEDGCQKVTKITVTSLQNA